MSGRSSAGHRPPPTTCPFSCRDDPEVSLRMTSRGALLPRVLEQLRQIVQEAPCRDAVHDAVVVGERDWKDSPYRPAGRNRLVDHDPRRGSANAKHGGLSGGERCLLYTSDAADERS